MSKAATGEFAFIDWLRQRTPPTQRVLLGPGDDTAMLNWPRGPNCLVTTDMLLEGSCFRLAETHSGAAGAGTARQIGRKALAVNLSDIAAMAGIPIAAVVSVGLPQKGGRALAEELYLGLREMADSFDTAIIGGDTNSWDGPLVISVTALGEVPNERRWLRSGAQPGDAIVVTGQLGGSILGRHFDFTPRVPEALWLAENADVHAAIDVSDGLSLDLSRICEASGCGAVIDLEKVPIAAAAAELARKDPNGLSPLDHALGDGEDF